jgi:PKD repeat protein
LRCFNPQATRWIPVVALLSLVTACGGGGGGGGDSNRAPTASFTATPSSGGVPLTVSFNAGASADSDGSIASYAWNFGDNSTGTGVAPTHTYTTAGNYPVTLTVTDNRGATAVATSSISAGPPLPPVTVSGRITFERVPFGPLGRGLDYTATFEAPAREIEVDIVRVADQAVLATAVTDTDGRYSASAPANTNLFVRAKAVSRRVATAAQPASWDLRVRDNTRSGALFVLDGSAFNTGTIDHTRNLKAPSGWGGGFTGVYTSPRSSAPFAVLDTLYSAVRFVAQQGDPAVQLPALVAYWSPRNVATDGDLTTGRIGTTAYYPPGTEGVAPGIYVLGAAANTLGDPTGLDTDEFDPHVVAHEFLHYLEDAVSRTDTVGGPHSLEERLDMRVAFSEGLGNAFCAMVLDDPLYRDSFGTAQGDDSHFNVETFAASTPGWYTEASIHRILWDLFDGAADGVDVVALGFGPLYDVFRSELRTGVPLSSLFPFITALKQRPGVPAPDVDRIVQAEQVPGTDFGIVSAGMDAYASTETHGGGSTASLPVYASVAVGGSQTVCGDVAIGTYNALGNRRFLRFTASTTQTITIRAECVVTVGSTCGGDPSPDPDFVLRRAGTSWVAEKEGAVETLGPLSLEAGEYVIEAYDYSHVDLDNVTRRGRTCLRITLTSG